MELRKYWIMAAFVGSVIGFGFSQSHAAIAVIDMQNIAQQAKTYAESVKLVTQTAQQITLQAKELAAFPSNLINSYNQGINNSLNNLKNTLTKATTTFATTATEAQIKSYWENKFTQINADDNWAISEQNKEMMAELDANQKMLNELLRKNADIEGNKQGQQLANQIAGIKANIDRINLNMQALEGKHKVESAQAKITSDENQQIIAEAKARAEEAELQKARDNQFTAAKTPRPFEKYEIRGDDR